MTYSTNLPVKGKVHPAATREEAKAYARARNAKRLPEVDLFIDTVWDRGDKMSVRPEVPFGQWSDETDVGKSAYWYNNLNPGGLRITYPGEPSKTWANGEVAALG